MPRISKAELAARRDEILDSCAALYESTNYRDITMAQIAEGVSFGRANIYNYFSCKDEVMLALLTREHERWADDLDAVAQEAAGLSDDGFANRLAGSLESRVLMLKLLAMNLYDMEQNSSVEALTQLKIAYGRMVASLRSVIVTAKPSWSEGHVGRFAFAFLPFLHGVYPYVHHTEKQLAAMERASVAAPGLGVADMVRQAALQLLSGD